MPNEMALASSIESTKAVQAVVNEKARTHHPGRRGGKRMTSRAESRRITRSDPVRGRLRKAKPDRYLEK
jgi:hypothetical protein